MARSRSEIVVPGTGSVPPGLAVRKSSRTFSSTGKSPASVATAYRWSSTKQKVGIWLINPSNEYMSGGPTKLELSAHRDATFTDSLTAPAPATILNVWKGPHYGGTVAGPIFAHIAEKAARYLDLQPQEEVKKAVPVERVALTNASHR